MRYRIHKLGASVLEGCGRRKPPTGGVSFPAVAATVLPYGVVVLKSGISGNCGIVDIEEYFEESTGSSSKPVDDPLGHCVVTR